MLHKVWFIFIIEIAVNIDINDIFKFSELRIACHVRALNYFAGILGYSFPEHDNDKNVEPMRTGYAYIIYAAYHKNFRLLPEHEQLCLDAKKVHYQHAPHHVAHYQNVTDIPDIRIYEMVSDWSSANFEQKYILCLKDTPDINDWFEQNHAKLPWTPHQLELIRKSLKIISEKTDIDTVRAIWQPALAQADL